MNPPPADLRARKPGGLGFRRRPYWLRAVSDMRALVARRTPADGAGSWPEVAELLARTRAVLVCFVSRLWDPRRDRPPTRERERRDA